MRALAWDGNYTVLLQGYDIDILAELPLGVQMGGRNLYLEIGRTDVPVQISCRQDSATVTLSRDAYASLVRHQAFGARCGTSTLDILVQR